MPVVEGVKNIEIKNKSNANNKNRSKVSKKLIVNKSGVLNSRKKSSLFVYAK
jgi:hypothetical protein